MRNWALLTQAMNEELLAVAFRGWTTSSNRHTCDIHSRDMEQVAALRMPDLSFVELFIANHLLFSNGEFKFGLFIVFQVIH